jgi:DNA ligase-associated metallophosphoesterase
VLRVEIASEELWLSAERCIWWPARRTLIVADLHIGKSASFRALGVPVPERTTDQDLARLARLIEATGATRLVLLGDLLHARHGRSSETMDCVGAWRDRHAALEMLLVRGNHDRKAGDPPPEWRIECVDNGHVEGAFVWRHEPEEDERGYAMAGHIHPAATMHGRGGGLRAPCFWFGAKIGVLPAFGSFTGMKPVRPKRGDGVYVVGDGQVIGVGGMERIGAGS